MHLSASAIHAEVVAIIPPRDTNEPVADKEAILHLAPASLFDDHGYESGYIRIKPMFAVPEAPAGAETLESDSESEIEVVSFGVTKAPHDRRQHGSDGHKPAWRRRNRLRKAIPRRATSASRAHVRDLDGRNRRLPRVLNIEEVPGHSVPSSIHRSREASVTCCTLHVSQASSKASLPELLTASTDDVPAENSTSHNATTGIGFGNL
ncbi:hypothetical protein MTO96_024393 [Rhipicephalus appendiculatus]